MVLNYGTKQWLIKTMAIRKATKRLKTLQKEAEAQGFRTLLTQAPVTTSPKTGKIVKLRNRNILYVFDTDGSVKFRHMSGLPRETNDRVEQKLGLTEIE
jgi:hypothetical protein